jgi:hypothetical protein
MSKDIAIMVVYGYGYVFVLGMIAGVLLAFFVGKVCLALLGANRKSS